MQIDFWVKHSARWISTSISILKIPSYKHQDRQEVNNIHISIVHGYIDSVKAGGKTVHVSWECLWSAG